MTKTTRIVCLCILGAVGTLCGVSTINAPITEDKTELITPTEPLRSAYIVANIAMQDPVAISLQGELYVLERRVLAEYNGDNTLFTSRADVLRLDEDLQSRQPLTTYDIATGEIAKFDNAPTTTYLAPISSSGDLMLLEFTRKPTRFRLVMRPAPVATSHHIEIPTHTGIKNNTHIILRYSQIFPSTARALKIIPALLWDAAKYPPLPHGYKK